MDDSHLFLQAKREKRWLSFIEVRVSHLFFRHEVGKRWLTATTMDDSHLFFHSDHHSGKAATSPLRVKKEVAVCPF
jgi:hypothetical protein